MAPATFYQVYLISIGILLILLIRTLADNDRHFVQHRLFLAMILCTLLATVSEAGTWLLDGHTGPVLRELSHLFNIFLFSSSLGPVMCWITYTHYQILKPAQTIRRVNGFMITVAGGNILLALASPWTGWYYVLDSLNSYTRGTLFFIPMAVNLLLLLWALGLIIRHRQKVPRRLLLPMTLFCLPPVLGAVLQLVFYGFNMIWACMALSLLIIYTSIQKQILSTDYLTGLYNRRQLDDWMAHNQKSTRNDHCLAILMIDIDDFKSINDQHGHAQGDLAIEATAAILRKTFHHEDFLCRYAGDEFVAVIDINDPSGLDSLVLRLHQQFARFNKSNKHPWRLSVSVGGAIRQPGDSTTVESLLSLADKRMYEAKAEFKRLNADAAAREDQKSSSSTQAAAKLE